MNRFQTKASKNPSAPYGKFSVINTNGETLGERFVCATDTEEKADLVASALNLRKQLFEVIEAFKQMEEARRKVLDPNNRAAMAWNSPEQKELERLKDEFMKAVRRSEYDDIFDAYADEVYRWS